MLGDNELKIVISALDKTGNTFSNISNKAKGLSNSLKSIGKKMSLGITAPIMAAGGASIKAGYDFSKSVEYANTMMKLGKDEMKSFENGVLSLSSKYGKSANDIASAAYPIASVLHTNEKDTIKILEATTRAAKAGKISVSDSANAIIRLMSIYGIKAQDANRLTDILAGTINAGNANWQDLAEVLPQVAGTAKPLGVSLEETAAAFAAMSSKSGSSAEAGTALRGVLMALMKPSDKMKEALKDMGYDSGQAAIKAIGLSGVLKNLGEKYGDNAEALGDLIPNIRGITGASELFSNHGKDLADALDMVKNSQGEVNKQIEAGEGPAEKFEKAMNNVKNAGIQLFITVEPYITQLMEYIGKLTEKLSNLSPHAKKMIIISLGIAAAIGPVLTVVGNLISLIGVLGTATTFLATNPVVLLVAALAGLVTVGIYVVKNWDTIKIKLEGIVNHIKITVETKLKAMYAAVANWVGRIKKSIESTLGPVIRWLEAKFQGIINKINEIKERARSAVSRAGSVIRKGASRILGSRQFGGYIPQTGTYLLHQGEYVVPRNKVGGGITININGGTYLSPDVAEEIGDMIIDKLKMQFNF